MLQVLKKKTNLWFVLVVVCLVGYIAYDKLVASQAQVTEEAAGMRFQRSLKEGKDALAKATQALADLEGAYQKALSDKASLEEARIEAIVEKKISAKAQSSSH